VRDLSFQARLNAIRNATSFEKAEELCRYWSVRDPDCAHVYEAEFARWWKGVRR
jgi:hypothetical protein